jgi:FtsZ-binding cell division protein ZapB
VLTADYLLGETDVSDSVENLEKLEAKILKVADLLRRSQAEKRSLLEQLTKIRADLDKQAKSSDGLEREALTLRREREEVRSRIEKLLRQIDEVAKSEPGA